jgi:xyloglucan-specific exo-beta-1,4-glucanase
MSHLLLLFLLAYLSTSLQSSPPRQLPVTVSSLGIGGGGFTTGIVPTLRSAVGNSTVFFRTDVGGVYRLLDNNVWKPLIDFFTFRDRNRYGGDSIAVSTENSSKVWISLGAYFNEPGNVLILSSENFGDTWRTLSPLRWNVRGGSNNSTYRSLGERLAVHPIDSRGIVLYGSYLDGLWRTENSNSKEPTWSQISCGSTNGLIPCNLPYGVLALIFDSGSINGDTVFASIPTIGVMRSFDAGKTWTILDGGPVFAKRFAFAFSYIPTSYKSSPLFASAMDGIWSFEPENSTWFHYQPFGPGISFSGIDVNPFDSNDIISLSEQVNGIARSRDGGKSWNKVMNEYLMIYELPWWVSSFGHNNTPVDFIFGMCGNLKFGTASSDIGNTIYLGDSWNMWTAKNFNLATFPPPPSGELVELIQMPKGHEETFILSMISPHTPFPFLLTGTADLAGLLHESSNWKLYSNWSFFGPGNWGAEGTGISYTESVTNTSRDGQVPARIAVAQTRAYAGNNSPLIQISDDGGRTWQVTTFNKSIGAPNEVLGVAIGAWTSNEIVALVGNTIPWYSNDNGNTWASVSGLPSFLFPQNGYTGNRYNQSRPLVSDRSLISSSTSGVFYYADCTSGNFYISTNGGASFRLQSQLAFPSSTRCILEPHPTLTGGALWLALNEKGLMFVFSNTSSPNKSSIIQVESVSIAHSVAVGAPQENGKEPAVYIFGLLNTSPPDDDLHVLVSLDRGLTWADLRATSEIGLGNWPEVLVASRYHFGVVGVGSFGRGAFFFNASSVLAIL